MSDFVLLGLDGEMTGTGGANAHEKFQLIQVGLAYGAPDPGIDIFVHDIGYQKFHFTAKALEVNGFTKERINAGMSPQHVDAKAVLWLEERGLVGQQQLVPVGWNVAGFDVPFFRQYLPGLSACLSYRTLDLNALVFAYSLAHGLPYERVKKAAKKHAQREMRIAGFDDNWHDAGYDAAAALFSLDYLINLMKKGTGNL